MIQKVKKDEAACRLKNKMKLATYIFLFSYIYLHPVQVLRWSSNFASGLKLNSKISAG